MRADFQQRLLKSTVLTKRQREALSAEARVRDFQASILKSVILTKRQREILIQMRDHRDDDEGELVYERGVGYLGEEPVAARTIFALVRACAISISQDSQVGGLERYTINETGIALIEREAGV